MRIDTHTEARWKDHIKIEADKQRTKSSKEINTAYTLISDFQFPKL